MIALTWFVTRAIDSLILSLTLKILIAATLYTLLLWLSGSQILRESLHYLTHKRP